VAVPKLAHVIERCLALDPEDRWQAAADVRASSCGREPVKRRRSVPTSAP
jgi:hypothetical protein